MTPAERVGIVREKIAAAAARAGRDPSDVTLIAVGKTHPVDAIAAVAAEGVTDFGENRIQEAETKVPQLGGFRWHFIGHLQRNKARRATELFELIHSVDSTRLGRALGRFGAERGRPVEGLVEVNLGGESSKSGVAEDELPRLLEELAAVEGLRLRGLMAIPPWCEDPERARPYFRRLARLRERCAADHPALTELSMGMSGDFEIAIEEGATFVRVGTALFGPRLPR